MFLTLLRWLSFVHTSNTLNAVDYNQHNKVNFEHLKQLLKTGHQIFGLWRHLIYLAGTSPVNLFFHYNVLPLIDHCKEKGLEIGLLWVLQGHHGTSIVKITFENMEVVSALTAMRLKKSFCFKSAI